MTIYKARLETKTKKRRHVSNFKWKVRNMTFLCGRAFNSNEVSKAIDDQDVTSDKLGS